MASVRDSKRWVNRNSSSLSTNSFFRRRWTNSDGVLRGIGKNIQEMPHILAIYASYIHYAYNIHHNGWARKYCPSIGHSMRAHIYQKLHEFNLHIEQGVTTLREMTKMKKVRA